MQPAAYSYLRFSSAEQARGDSIRRQVEATAGWCERNGITLDTTLRDEGVSAFKGRNRENPDVHGMAAFLQAVKTGRVPAGSFLILENLDRLSREKIVPAVNLFTGLLMAGVKVVQLRPVEQVFTSAADMTGIMLAIVELSRGNSESVMKSERIGAAWVNKRRHAATTVLTAKVPSWIRYVEGKLVLDPKKAATVRRLFDMALDGKSLTDIARAMNEKKVPLIGRTVVDGRPVVWSAALVYKVITSPSTHGEFQSHTGERGDRKPVGEPIKNYYPPVVTRAEFDRVALALSSRAKLGRGRRGKHINLFAGILKDARTGGALMARHHSTRESIIFPVGATHGRGDRWVTYPLFALERAIISRLVEVKIEDIQPDAPPASRVEGLAARHAELEELLKKWRAKMDRPELVDVVADKLADLEADRREVAAELAREQRDAASPLSEAIGNLRVVGASLAEDNSDENRIRCRSAIRRAVEAVWCLFIPGRTRRLAAVQVWFKNGAHREYMVAHRPRGASQRWVRAAETSVRSFAEAGLSCGDLRKRDEAALLERLILKHGSTATAETAAPVASEESKQIDRPRTRKPSAGTSKRSGTDKKRRV